MRFGMSVCALVLLSGCTPSKPSVTRRAEIQELGGSAVRFIPLEGQLPYCLLFTVSAKGVVRQLTMNAENTAIRCKAGKPIGGVTYQIPPSEGKIRAHILFADRPVEASDIGMQIHDLAAENPSFMAMDLRAPGRVMLETLEFTPTLEGEGVTIRADGVVEGPGGSAAPSAAASAPRAK